MHLAPNNPFSSQQSPNYSIWICEPTYGPINQPGRSHFFELIFSFCKMLIEKLEDMSDENIMRLAAIYAAGSSEKVLSNIIEGLQV